MRLPIWSPSLRHTIVAGLCVAPCLAATSIVSRAAPSAYDACMAKAMSTLSMQDCQSTEVARIDARIHAVLVNVLASLPADQQTKLRASQKLWATFRRSDCDVYYGSETGTIATIEGGNCTIARGRDRVNDLRAFEPERH